MGRRRNNLSCGRDWSELHSDVLMTIFVKMGTLEVLRAAGSVCRSWGKVVKEEPEIWRRIDMTNHGYGHDAFVLVDAIQVAIDRSKGRLEELSIENLGDDELLRYLFDRTSVLKKLCLMWCYEISEEAIAETANGQPLLEEINITFGSFSEEATEIIGRGCPQLKTFKYNDIWYSEPPFIPDDCVETFDDQDALGIANTMHQLRHLQLIGNRMTYRGLRAIVEGCPHLETLDIHRCRNVNMNVNMQAICARLKTIRLPEDSVDDYQFEADNDHNIDHLNFWLEVGHFYKKE